MSYFLRVFCQDSKLLKTDKIIDFINQGYFFEQLPDFKIKNTIANAEEINWETITVLYDRTKRPVRIERIIDAELIQQEVLEIINHLKGSNFNPQPDLIYKLATSIYKLATSKQVIVLEVDPVGLTDAGWEMLDCLESYLAKNLSGLIYAPDQGFFDSNLKLFYDIILPTNQTNQNITLSQL